MSDTTEETNENTEYEILAKEIYQALHDTEGFDTVDVQHNVKIPGKSGCNHQIDVFWEFKMAGETHRVAIECKNYLSSISVGRIRDFFGVLHDIGNIKGIFVTKKGYQSGAKKFANYYGISTKELRFPKPEDWDGRVKDIVTTMSICIPVVKKTDIEFDHEWILGNTEIQEGEQIQFNCMDNEFILSDSEGNQITTLYDLKNELPQNWKEEKDLVSTHSFDVAFVSIGDKGPLKINKIEFTYDVQLTEQQFTTEGEGIAKAILLDVESGEIKFYDKHGKIK